MRFSLATILSFGLLAAAFPTAPIATYDASPSSDVASPSATAAPFAELPPTNSSPKSAPAPASITDLSAKNSTSGTEELERALGLGSIHPARDSILGDLLGGCTSGCGGSGHSTQPETVPTTIDLDLDLLTKLTTCGNNIADIVLNINTLCGGADAIVLDLNLKNLLLDLKAQLAVLLDLFLDVKVDLLGIKISICARIWTTIIIDIVLALKLVLTACIDSKDLVQDVLDILAKILVQLKLCGINLGSSLNVVSDILVDLGLKAYL
ncbi:hypothetical protein BOTBODRAFT_57926 [Botryobasidium botryosum FD-172 SS1]|uniref:Hydrophobin n=1 Tax=Botryobasidium botryosum (strain FD-172 SS1) TaxID=930990 RepID=A0A067MFR1_BOTB1|nr:hypothetical protein BOTBODRAFT_57926 [Botryobasidium botryosum FD-172 SS1]